MIIMAKKKQPGRKPIEIYKHKEQKRTNNPQAGVVTSKTDSPHVKTKQYKYDENLDPELNFDSQKSRFEKIISKGLAGSLDEAQSALKKLKKLQAPFLNWVGKAERLSFEVPTIPLHIHEKIDPRSIIETVRHRNSLDYGQLSLFHKESEKRPLEKEIEFYKHEKLWSNRLIAGDSLLVMNSLLEKESMAGKVQCFYFDPPYGVEYGSNFQPFTNKRDVKHKKDEDLTAEPETIKAFRDTWELGIHSYLSYLRDRLLLARDLLTDSGSCFVQISDENVHLVRNLMDEIFGKDNFCAIIPFRKKTWPLGSKVLEQMSDFLIWYGKDKNQVKYNQLYIPKEMNPDNDWCWLELQDGSRHKMNRKQIEGIEPIPDGAKIYRLRSLEPLSENLNKKFTYFFNGKYIQPPRRGYSVNKEGLKILDSQKRLQLKGNLLNFISFKNDFPIIKLTTPWIDTTGARNKVYAVQTNPLVIQRCILMATAPGDLIFDPTCGSGTTAYVAEKWGRRWITCDSSRVAVALAKQRLMTANFDYYELKDEKKGINEGFNYKEVPYISEISIAYKKDIKAKILYDQPHIDKNKFRVSGPFTVEAVPAVKVETLSGELLNGADSPIKQDWLFALKAQGIKGKKGLSRDIEFTRLEIMNDTKYIFAEGQTKDLKRVIVCFGSEYAPLEQRQVELGLKEAKLFRPDIVIFCAFQFDPEAGRDVDELDLKWTKTLKVQMNSDLFTKDLKNQSKGDSFWLVGQPDISLKKLSKGEHKGKYIVDVEGFDYYDTKTNSIQRGGKDRIAMWMLDTDYDGRSLYPRQVFFPLSTGRGGWERLKKALRSEINEDLMNQFKGTRSLPFKKERYKKIAVKIIDDRGIESLVIKALNETA